MWNHGFSGLDKAKPWVAQVPLGISIASRLGPICAGLVEWPEDSEEEDPTSGTAAVAYRKGSCSVVRLDADEVHLGVDDAAWVPARVDPASAPGPFLIATNGFSQVRCVAGFWEARQGLALVLNVQDVEVDLPRGDMAMSGLFVCNTGQ